MPRCFQSTRNRSLYFMSFTLPDSHFTEDKKMHFYTNVLRNVTGKTEGYFGRRNYKNNVM